MASMSNTNNTKANLVEGLDSIARTAKRDKGLFQIVLSYIPMPYLLVDSNERVAQSNQACLDMLEIKGPVESCYGKTLAEVFYNDPTHNTLVGQSMRDGTTFRDVEICITNHK